MVGAEVVFHQFLGVKTPFKIAVLRPNSLATQTLELPPDVPSVHDQGVTPHIYASNQAGVSGQHRGL